MHASQTFRWRAAISGVAAAVCLAALTAGCGLAVAIEPVPSTIPGGGPQAPAPAPALVPGADAEAGSSSTSTSTTPPAPLVTSPPPDRTETELSLQSPEDLVSEGAGPTCQTGASFTYHAAASVQVGFDAFGLPASLSTDQQRESIGHLRDMLADARSLVDQVSEDPGGPFDERAVRGSLDALDSLLDREPSDGDVRLVFRRWIAENSESVGQLAGVLVRRCPDEPFVTYLGVWQ